MIVGLYEVSCVGVLALKMSACVQSLILTMEEADKMKPTYMEMAESLL